MDTMDARNTSAPRSLPPPFSLDKSKVEFTASASQITSSSFEPSGSGSTVTPKEPSRSNAGPVRDPLRVAIPPLYLAAAPPGPKDSRTRESTNSLDSPFASYPANESQSRNSPSSSCAGIDNMGYSGATPVPPSGPIVQGGGEANVTHNLVQDDEADAFLAPPMPIASRQLVHHSSAPSQLPGTGPAFRGVLRNLGRVPMRVVNIAAVGLENQVKDEASTTTEATIQRVGYLKRSSLRGRALGILGPRNSVRVAFLNILQCPWAEPMILVLIILNAVVLIIQSTSALTSEKLEDMSPITGYFHSWEDWALFILFVLFTLEAIARICVSGFLLDPEVSITRLFASPLAEYHDTPNLTDATSPIDGPIGPLTRGLSLTERLSRLHSNLCRPFALRSDVEAEKRPFKTQPETNTTERQSHCWEFSQTQEDIDLPPLLQRTRAERLLTLPFKLNFTEGLTVIEWTVPYLRHSWSRIDFIAIISFWITVILASTGVERGRNHIGIFRALSVLRVSRLLSITAGTTTIMHSLKRARHLLLNVIYFVAFAMILFSIIGVQSFKGSPRRFCYITPTLGEPEIQTEQVCGGYIDPVTLEKKAYITSEGTTAPFVKGFLCPLGQICKSGSNANSGAESFDTIYNAALQVIITASTNGWTLLMYSTIDAEFFASSIFYITCVSVVGFLFMSLFVVVITSSFSAIRAETKKSAFGASISEEDSEASPDDGWDDAIRWHRQNWARRICSYTEWVRILLSIASFILRTTRSVHTPAGGFHDLSLEWGELVITFAFDAEVILQFLASLPHWHDFFRVGRNWLDLVLAIACSIIQIPVIRNSNVYECFTIFQPIQSYRLILISPRMESPLLSVKLASMTLSMMLVNFVSALVAVQLLRGDLSGKELITFGDLYNAFLGVYQAFSSENWTNILYDPINAEEKYRQVVIVTIFWVVWEFFANFLMLQMLIVVINKNFEDSEKAKESELASHYWAMHAGESTPEWIKKLNPYRWMETQSESPDLRDKRERQESINSGLFSRLSMRNPSSGSRQSRQPRHYQNKSLSALQRLIAEQNFELAESVKARECAFDLHSKAYNERLKRKAQFIRQHPTYDKTFWIFSQQNHLRRTCQLLVKPANSPRIFGTKTSPILELIFQLILLIATVAGIGVESVATPLYRRTYYQQYGLVNWPWFDICEWAFGFVLMIEFVIKIIPDGLIFTPNAYIFSIWNVFDLAVLAGLIDNLSTAVVLIGGLSRLTRSLKALRVLRLITLIGKMHKTYESFIIARALGIMDTAFPAMLCVIPWAVCDLIRLHDQMKSWNDKSADGLINSNGEYTVSAFGYLVPKAWDNPSPSTTFSFDTFWSSLLILFEGFSLEGWTYVMYLANSITGHDLQPQTNASQLDAIFFLIFNLFGGVVILVLFVSIITVVFIHRTGSVLLTQAQREWFDLQKLFKRQTPSKRPRVRPHNRLRGWCFDRAVQKHGWWSRLMTIIFVLHIFGLMTQTFTKQKIVDEFRNDFFLGVTCFYIADVLIRLYGLGFRSFYGNGWNNFDVVVVTGSFVTTLAVRFGNPGFATEQLQKLFLVSIAFKLVQRNDSLNMLFKTAVSSLPTIVSLLALWLTTAGLLVLCPILFFSFALLYVEGFRMPKWSSNGDHNVNYSAMANANVVRAFVSVGEGWHTDMHDYVVVYSRCTNSGPGALLDLDCGSFEWALVLFIAWSVLWIYICVKSLTGVVVGSFSYVIRRIRGGALAITREEMRLFKKLWAEHTSPVTGMLEEKGLVPFLGKLSGPFEVRIYPREFDILRLLKDCADYGSGGDLVVDAIDIRKLNGMLKSLDVADIHQRRIRYNRIYHEVLRHLREHGGIDFTKMLILLAHHKLIVKEDALTGTEYSKRIEVMRDVRKVVSIDRAHSMLKTYLLRRKFIIHRIRMLEEDGHFVLRNLLLRWFEKLGNLKDIDRSIAIRQQVLDHLVQTDDHPHKPAILAGLGFSLLTRFERLGELGDLDRSIVKNQQALDLTPDEHPHKPAILTGLGFSLLSRFEREGNLEELDSSIVKHQQAVDLTPAGHPDKPFRLISLGNSLRVRYDRFSHSGDYARLVSSYRSAALSPSGEPSIRFSAAHSWANILYPDLEPCRAVISLIPQVAWLGRPIEQRYNDLQTLGNAVLESVSAACAAGAYDEALEWLEQGRAIIWGQILQLRSPFADLQISHPELARLVKRIASALDGRSKGNSRPSESTLSLEQAAQKHRRLAERWESLTATIRQLPGFTDFFKPKSAATLKKASTNTTIVIVNASGRRCDALMLRLGSTTLEHLHLASLSLEKLIQAQKHFEQSLKQAGVRVRDVARATVKGYGVVGPLPSVLKMLWVEVAKPILDHLGYITSPATGDLPHITWCLTGPLACLPIHAAGLYNNPSGREKIFNYVVSSYTPSLTAFLVGLEKTPTTTAPSILAITQMDAPGLPQIPGTIEEVNMIEEQMMKRSLGLRRMDGNQATVEAVLEAMDQHNWLHLSCHGSQDSAEPIKSAFFLNNGRLELAEIMKRPRKHAELAYLSACQTATGDSSLPDEAMHLAAGMFTAGYRSVVGTLWAIRDNEAPRVAQVFYERLLTNPEGGVARAVHEAVAELRNSKVNGEIDFMSWIPYIHIGH